MQESIATVKPFVGGLNTELTQIDEYPKYTSDELNCRILPDGARSRRYGMGVEQDGDLLYEDESTAYSAFFWDNVNNVNKDILVAQVGSTLKFRNAIRPFSSQDVFFELDLSPYIIESAGFNNSQLAYSTGAGRLFVVNKYMDSLLLTYNAEDNTVEAEKIQFKVRDFEGIEDGYEIDEMPTTNTPEHTYNLYNQGWTDTQIQKFYEEKSKYPANNMQWFVGKDSTGTFDPNTLLSKYFGNTPAPKGHYILDALTKNRTEASGVIASGDSRFFNYQYWRYRKNDKYHVICWDRQWMYYEIPNNSGKLQRISIDFQMTASEKYSPNNIGDYHDTIEFTCEGLRNGTWEQIVAPKEYEAEQDALSQKWTYKILETPSTEISYDKFRIAFRTLGEGYYHYWRATSFSGSTQCGDAVAFPYTGAQYRVADVNFTAGKFFYLLQQQVLFSQTVTENIKNCNKCYQDADPTSEEISDIIATDGGAITFNGIGDGVGLAKCAIGLMVFGTKSTYAIVSGVTGNFSAESYTTQFVNNAGAHSRGSIIETEDSIYYWSPQGIIRVYVNAATGLSMITDNISVGTIQTWYQSIPKICRDNCQGVYDATNRRIHWYYPTNEEEPLKLDGVLVLDLKYGAFTPYKLSNGGYVVAPFTVPTPNEIVPSMFLWAGDDEIIADEDTVIAKEYDVEYNEYSSVCHISKLSDNTLLYSEFNSRDFFDWIDYDFEAYMVSYPLIVSDTYSYKQTPIVQTIFKRTEEELLRDGNYLAPTGCKYRTRWQWSIGDESNRWDMLQNCYFVPDNFKNYKYLTSKIVVRGRGKAFQIELRNDENKDMRIIGINTVIRGE